MFATKAHNVQRHVSAETTDAKIGFTKYGELPIIGMLVGIAGGMLSLIVLFALVPVIGASVEDAMPATNGSDWDPDTNDKIATGIELWESIGPLLILCALIAVIMIVLRLLGVF